MKKKEKVQVIKRDGAIEDFSKEKLLRVAIATGISQQNAKDIIEKITKWAKEHKKVKSTEIKKIFSAELRKVRPYSADLYDWYQKVKIKNMKNNYNLKSS